MSFPRFHLLFTEPYAHFEEVLEVRYEQEMLCTMKAALLLQCCFYVGGLRPAEVTSPARRPHLAQLQCKGTIVLVALSDSRSPYTCLNCFIFQKHHPDLLPEGLASLPDGVLGHGSPLLLDGMLQALDAVVRG